MSEGAAGDQRHDDAVLPEVRWIGLLVMIVLLTASFLLYVFPGDTDAHFAWPVMPEMTAIFMGSCYGAGAYFFYRVSFGGSWHAVAAYFPGIALFTLLMGIATFLHWGKFNHDHVSFIAWLALYVTTPIIVPALYIRNRHTDPGGPDPRDAAVAEGLRRFVGFGGGLLVVISAVMFVAPSVAIDLWPWTLSELTSRVIAAFLAAPGVAAIVASRDGRWSAWRVLVRASVLSTGLLLIGAIRGWDEFDSANLLAYAFVGGIGVLCLGGILLDRMTEARLEPVATAD